MSSSLAVLTLYFLLIESSAGATLEKPLEEGSDERTAVNYCIIVTGGELLKGKYQDSHTQFITQALSPYGFRCLTSVTASDRKDDLRAALEYASGRASFVLVTGGLGPTEDDITRSTLSEFTGIELEENGEVILHLEKRFSEKAGKLRKNIRLQAMTPKRGAYLPNPYGTAVGLVFDGSAQTFVALPGPPGELRPMLRDQLLPFLKERYGAHAPETSLQLRFVGIGESSIAKVIQDHLELPPELEVSSLFEAGRVDLTFSLPGSSPADRATLRNLQSKLEEVIGQYLYTDDGATLEEHVLERMVRRNMTLTLAEVGSGGAVSASLSNLAYSGRVIRGGLTATSDARLLALVLPEGHDRAKSEGEKALVRGLCQRFNSTWGLVVTEQKSSETGHRSVAVLIGNSEGIFVKKRLRVRGSGEPSRQWLVSGTLDLLRRSLDSM